MPIDVLAGELAGALSQLAGCVEKKTTIPVLSSVYLSADAGSLTLRATDLEVGLTLRIPCSSMIQQSACVDLSRLLPVVKSFAKDAPLSLSFSESHWATLKCGNTSARMPGYDPASFPDHPAAGEEPAVTISASALCRMVRNTEICVTKEASRFTLNGALFQVGDGAAAMVSTDGHRMALSHAPATGQMLKILPLKLLSLIDRVFDGAEGDVQIYNVENHTVIHGPSGQVLVGRYLTGNFPDWQRVFPRELPGKFQVSSSDLLMAVGRCMGFADSQSKAMRFELVDGGLQVSVASSDTGEAEDLVTCQHDGEPYRVAFNGGYIADFARLAPALEWHFKDGNTAARLAALDGSAEWVVMPMRI